MYLIYNCQLVTLFKAYPFTLLKKAFIISYNAYSLPGSYRRKRFNYLAIKLFRKNREVLFAIHYKSRYTFKTRLLFINTLYLNTLLFTTKNEAITSCKMAIRVIKGKVIASSFNLAP